MKVAIVGCGHGALDQIYDTIENANQEYQYKVDLLIVCGDFQSIRNEQDLACMACPDKYKEMNSFYKYYSGERIAPVLTIFIGGNHEASNYLQELFYGGYVAPNMYYLGSAGVIRVGGLRIGGISGIFDHRCYNNMHSTRDEFPPYIPSTQRTIYYVRRLQAMQLELLEGPMDIFLSHDWPRKIWKYGDLKQLLRRKPYFAQDIKTESLGSPVSEAILKKLQPNYWFSGHMHVFFPAIVPHEGGNQTKFLALDKCLPGHDFMQFLDIGDPCSAEGPSISFDREWLSVLRCTQPYVATPARNLPSIEQFKMMLEEAKQYVDKQIPDEKLSIHIPFVKTAEAFVMPDSESGKYVFRGCIPPQQQGNPQTDQLLQLLQLTHVQPVTIAAATLDVDENEIDIGF